VDAGGQCGVHGDRRLLSDRLGRRRTLFVYLALMSLPVLYLMGVLIEHQWIMPSGRGRGWGAAARGGAALVTAMWVATLAYAVAQGLMYGTRSAIFMDVTNPAVAATQFTAYMAMMNLAISYSATWQGIAIEALGYPKTLLIDAVAGLLCLAVLPFIKPSATPAGDGGGARRAHVLAGCWRWVAWPGCPYRAGLLNGGRRRTDLRDPVHPDLRRVGGVPGGRSASCWATAPALGLALGLVMAPLLLAMYLRKLVATGRAWLYYGWCPAPAALLLACAGPLVAGSALQVGQPSPAPAGR
jgi:PAT family beta-lactamase induction signal transducer AmpG